MNDLERARLRDEEDRELYAIRRVERKLERGARDLTDGLDALAKQESENEAAIEREWQTEGWGHDPERPPSWREKL